MLNIFNIGMLLVLGLFFIFAIKGKVDIICILVLIFGIFSLSLTYGYYTFLQNENNVNYTIEEIRIPIYSVDIGSETSGKISGAFFIFSGYIKENLYYYYYLDNGNGGKILKKELAVDGIAIYEDENETPYRREIYKMYIDKNGNKCHAFFVLGYPKYELHIPPGSIVNNYNLSVMKE